MSLFAVSGPGVGLPLPEGNNQFNKPGLPWSAPGASAAVLQPAQALVLPPGEFAVLPGRYSMLQWLDPVSGQWSPIETARGHWGFVNSDGNNYRVANLSGTVIGATITDAGSGYTSAPVVTASAGGSTWKAIIGGAVGAVTVGTAGSGYGLAPLVLFDAPPAGGIQATGYATISSGAVSSITVTTAGAGYTVAPGITIVTNPLDPNLNVNPITPALATCVLAGSGTVTAVVPTYNGSALTSVPTLTFTGGGGSAAAATAIAMLAVTAVTVGTAGVSIPGSVVQILGVGGFAPGAFAYPANSAVRQANIYAPLSGGAVGTPVISDGGLYYSAPTALVVQESGAAPGTAPAVTFTLGGVNDTALFQPL